MPRQIMLALLLAIAAMSGCSDPRPDAAVGPVGASVPLPSSQPRQPIEPMSKEKAPPPVFDDSPSAPE